MSRAGAAHGVRLDSPPAILHQVPMRLIGLVVVLTLRPERARERGAECSTEIRTWSAHERISVRRTNVKENER